MITYWRVDLSPICRSIWPNSVSKTDMYLFIYSLYLVFRLWLWIFGTHRFLYLLLVECWCLDCLVVCCHCYLIHIFLLVDFDKIHNSLDEETWRYILILICLDVLEYNDFVFKNIEYDFNLKFGVFSFAIDCYTYNYRSNHFYMNK